MVTNNGIDFARSKYDFHYFDPIIVTQIHPTSGPSSGGTLVTVLGANFVGTRTSMALMNSDLQSKPVISCVFGGHLVSATFINASSVTCISPATTQDGPSIL